MHYTIQYLHLYCTLAHAATATEPAVAEPAVPVDVYAKPPTVGEPVHAAPNGAEIRCLWMNAFSTLACVLKVYQV